MSVTTVRDLTINTWDGFTFGAQRTLPAGTRADLVSHHGSAVVISTDSGLITVGANDVQA